MNRAHVHRDRAVSLLLIICVIAALPACGSTPPLAATVDPALLEYSDERRLARKERAAVPLEDRIAIVEGDMQRTLVPIGDGALAPRYLRHDGSKDTLHLEHNAAILSALAAKYAVTGDEVAKTLGEQVIRGIMELDALSGELNGFVHLDVHAGTFEPTERTTHANAYTQLLFSYVMAERYFGPIDEIERHVSLIYQRFLADDFALLQVDGTYMKRADLSGGLFLPLNARRTFDRRLLDQAAIHLGDAKTRELAHQHRWCGPMLGPMHVRVFNLELPTISSSWLNLQAMTALSLLGEDYQRQAIRLARRYERDNNPFLRIIAAIHGADEDLADIRSRLEEFPYPATSSGIINSHREDVSVAARRYVKFHAVPETREPLPMYEVRSDRFLWKRRLREIDSMPEERPRTLLGHDLYQAYWFLRLLEEEAFNTND